MAIKKEMKILLVEPGFPIPPKSKNHRDFLPVGLLKLASYHRERGWAQRDPPSLPESFQQR